MLDSRINQTELEVASLKKIKWLTYMMFFVFAMTSDAVGVIIPKLVADYGLSLSQASAFHYAPMIFIAFSGLLLGYLADKWGRQITICVGLLLFSIASFSFALVDEFIGFVLLLSVIGCAIGLFKTGALALIGDISHSPQQHTNTMNKVEGYFGIGAMIGPAIVSYLLITGVSWKYLYIGAAVLCLGLCFVAYRTSYPKPVDTHSDNINLKQTLLMMKNPYAMGYSLAIALYVAVEVAIYVWMPSLLLDYEGSWIWLSTYALSVFFALRAGGRFLGAWLMQHFAWQKVICFSSSMVFVCYLGAMMGGLSFAIFLLPLSGLFMSVIYPTLNSKGISCFPKHQHGAVAGVILFFTAVSAALTPLFMGLVSDLFGHVTYGFYLATVMGFLLVLLSAYNLLKDPSKHVLERA